MKISPKPRKKDGKIVGYRFQYWDSEKGTPAYLKVEQYPVISNIKTEQEARDFCHRFNQAEATEAKKIAAHANLELQTRDFDFPAAIEAFTEVQAKVNKSSLTGQAYLEEMVRHLVHLRARTHPAQFTPEDYKLVLQKFDARAMGTKKKMRDTFNKWLKWCIEKGKLDYSQHRPIPLSVMQDLEAATLNKHVSVKLGSKAPVPMRQLKQDVQILTYPQLCKLVEAAEPAGLNSMLAKLFYIAAMTTFRRGAYLALQRSDVVERQGELTLYPKQTLQRYEVAGGYEWHVGPPDVIKDTPGEFPVWEPRLEQYIREWLDYSRGSNWLFPDPIGWQPQPDAAVSAPGELPYHPERLSRQFKDYLSAAGLPPMPLKNLRHSGANIIDRLASAEHAQKALGHTNVKTTRAHYLAKYDLGFLKDLAKKLA